MLMPSLSNQIRRAIKASPFTAYRISKEARIDRGLMSRFLAGRQNLSLNALDRISNYLKWQIKIETRRKRP